MKSTLLTQSSVIAVTLHQGISKIGKTYPPTLALPLYYLSPDYFLREGSDSEPDLS